MKLFFGRRRLDLENLTYMLAYRIYKDNFIGNLSMANISVRKLDKRAYEQLRVHAEKHGVSMEEEARQIIYQAVSAPERISCVFLKYFGSRNGVNLDIH